MCVCSLPCSSLSTPSLGCRWVIGMHFILPQTEWTLAVPWKVKKKRSLSKTKKISRRGHNFVINEPFLFTFEFNFGNNPCEIHYFLFYNIVCLFFFFISNSLKPPNLYVSTYIYFLCSNGTICFMMSNWKISQGFKELIKLSPHTYCHAGDPASLFVSAFYWKISGPEISSASTFP